MNLRLGGGDLAGAGVNQAAGRQLAIADLDNRLSDGGEVVSLTRRLRFAPMSLLLISDRGCQPQGDRAAGRIRKIENNPMTS
jgi:hypothetical protein